MTSTDQCTRLSVRTNLNDRIVSLKQDVQKRVQKVYTGLETHGVHSYMADRSPQCQFICSRLPKPSVQLDYEENPAKRTKIESNFDQFKHHCRFTEVKSLKQIRCRTFSHWPHRTKPSAEQMIVAGFFSCNVGDRVLCLYCNLICQQWTGDTDDPSEVHQTLSPQCPYVLSMLLHLEFSSTLILNENVNNQTHGLINTTQPRFDPIVYTTPCHPTYSNIAKRLESFTTWSQELSSLVEELVRSGFFYTGVNSAVTCFYCNGSLQNWSVSDNPVVEHARWFAHCAYAKQLCGDALHRKIQDAQLARQGRDGVIQSNEINQNSNSPVTNHRHLQIIDSNMLSRYVAARLDLSISQNLLDQNFKLSVIKRCWEDQLQIKQDDFVTDSDLLISCTILQKQIDVIQGNKENIIIPSVQMKLIREKKQVRLLPLPDISNVDHTETMQTESVPTTSTIITKENSEVLKTDSTKAAAISNPCIICYQDEKRLACIPCGHFTACVPCSHALRTCPICRKEIEAFVRIYI